LILEELGRGWTSIAGIVTSHLALAHAVARFGTAAHRKRLLPAMARGDLIGGTALSSPVAARRTRGEWTLRGSIPAVGNASQAAVFLVLGRISRDRTGCFLIERGAKDLRVGRARETLGGRGVGVADLHLNGARAEAGSALGGGAALAAHLGIAATAVGLAQAAFEAALRYSQQRSAFGKPICQHQAIQLKLADMATAITTARLLVHRAASALDARDPGEIECRMAKLLAAETAYQVSLEAMRIHGGYGYTTEFPVERYYRDAPHLMLALGGPELERLELSRLLVGRRADSFI
jgi:alkylation response protein AidB-like acyl-CoA dehydrogenase